MPLEFPGDHAQSKQVASFLTFYFFLTVFFSVYYNCDSTVGQKKTIGVLFESGKICMHTYPRQHYTGMLTYNKNYTNPDINL